MTWIWPVLAGFGIGTACGFGLCLILAALIKTSPMDGRTYTGDLGEDDDYDQFLHDLNHRGDAA